MNDLISRAAALDAIDGMKPMQGSLEQLAMKALCWAAVKTIQPVDAVPVVHARWTTERTWKHDGEWYCSACEYEPVVFMDSAFCPNCGAKMDGERRDDEND